MRAFLTIGRVLGLSALAAVPSAVMAAGAFVVVAEDFNSFGQAIVKKLIAEIADAGSPRGLLPGGG